MTLGLISTTSMIAIAFAVGILFVVIAIALRKRAIARRDARRNKEGFNRMRDHERNQRWCF